MTTADDIQASVRSAVRPVNTIQIHPDLARCIVRWLGKHIEFTRQPGHPGVPALLIETQKALAEAVAAIDDSRQREQERLATAEIVISGYDACVGTAEASAELGISADAVRWHIRRGNLASRKVGRQLMVTTSSLDRLKDRLGERKKA
ncbi:helix-turn-helix domain-containing protein [Mycobacterium sp. M23085]|uniref:helix-turn-helix domain-containing protein n=1 Tax=Mycobacterium sp. M23085 TaxID=3378087 RepID=UPI003877AB77